VSDGHDGFRWSTADSICAMNVLVAIG